MKKPIASNRYLPPDLIVAAQQRDVARFLRSGVSLPPPLTNRLAALLSDQYRQEFSAAGGVDFVAQSYSPEAHGAYLGGLLEAQRDNPTPENAAKIYSEFWYNQGFASVQAMLAARVNARPLPKAWGTEVVSHLSASGWLERDVQGPTLPQRMRAAGAKALLEAKNLGDLRAILFRQMAPAIRLAAQRALESGKDLNEAVSGSVIEIARRMPTFDPNYHPQYRTPQNSAIPHYAWGVQSALRGDFEERQEAQFITRQDVDLLDETGYFKDFSQLGEVPALDEPPSEALNEWDGERLHFKRLYTFTGRALDAKGELVPLDAFQSGAPEGYLGRNLALSTAELPAIDKALTRRRAVFTGQGQLRRLLAPENVRRLALANAVARTSQGTTLPDLWSPGGRLIQPSGKLSFLEPQNQAQYARLSMSGYRPVELSAPELKAAAAVNLRLLRNLPAREALVSEREPLEALLGAIKQNPASLAPLREHLERNFAQMEVGELEDEVYAETVRQAWEQALNREERIAGGLLNAGQLASGDLRGVGKLRDPQEYRAEQLRRAVARLPDEIPFGLYTENGALFNRRRELKDYSFRPVAGWQEHRLTRREIERILQDEGQEPQMARLQGWLEKRALDYGAGFNVSWSGSGLEDDQEQMGDLEDEDGQTPKTEPRGQAPVKALRRWKPKPASRRYLLAQKYPGLFGPIYAQEAQRAQALESYARGVEAVEQIDYLKTKALTQARRRRERALERSSGESEIGRASPAKAREMQAELRSRALEVVKRLAPTVEEAALIPESFGELVLQEIQHGSPNPVASAREAAYLRDRALGLDWQEPKLDEAGNLLLPAVSDIGKHLFRQGAGAGRAAARLDEPPPLEESQPAVPPPEFDERADYLTRAEGESFHRALSMAQGIAGADLRGRVDPKLPRGVRASLNPRARQLNLSRGFLSLPREEQEQIIRHEAYGHALENTQAATEVFDYLTHNAPQGSPLYQRIRDYRRANPDSPYATTTSLSREVAADMAAAAMGDRGAEDRISRMLGVLPADFVQRQKQLALHGLAQAGAISSEAYSERLQTLQSEEALAYYEQPEEEYDPPYPSPADRPAAPSGRLASIWERKLLSLGYSQEQIDRLVSTNLNEARARAMGGIPPEQNPSTDFAAQVGTAPAGKAPYQPSKPLELGDPRNAEASPNWMANNSFRLRGAEYNPGERGRVMGSWGRGVKTWKSWGPERRATFIGPLEEAIAGLEEKALQGEPASGVEFTLLQNMPGEEAEEKAKKEGWSTLYAGFAKEYGYEALHIRGKERGYTTRVFRKPGERLPFDGAIQKAVAAPLASVIQAEGEAYRRNPPPLPPDTPAEGLVRDLVGQGLEAGARTSNARFQQMSGSSKEDYLKSQVTAAYFGASKRIEQILGGMEASLPEESGAEFKQGQRELYRQAGEVARKIVQAKLEEIAKGANLEVDLGAFQHPATAEEIRQARQADPELSGQIDQKAWLYRNAKRGAPEAQMADEFYPGIYNTAKGSYVIGGERGFDQDFEIPTRRLQPNELSQDENWNGKKARRGMFSSSLGQIIYGAYIGKRVIGWTFDPVMQSAEGYAQFGGELAFGTGLDPRTSLAGYTQRRSEEGLWAGQGAFQEFGAFKDWSQILVDKGLGLSRLKSIFGLAGGIIGGGFGVAGAVGGIGSIGGGLASAGAGVGAAIGGAAPLVLALAGLALGAGAIMEARNALNPEEKPWTFGGAWQGMVAGQIRADALTELPSKTHELAGMGGMHGNQGYSDEELLELGKITASEYYFMKRDYSGADIAGIQELTQEVARGSGQEESKIFPSLRALKRFLPGVKDDSLVTFASEAALAGYALEEETQKFLDYAVSAGATPKSDLGVELFEQWSEASASGDFSRYSMEVKAANWAASAGRFGGLFRDPATIAQIAAENDWQRAIDTAAMPEIMGLLQMGGVDLERGGGEIAKFLKRYSAKERQGIASQMGSLIGLGVEENSALAMAALLKPQNQLQANRAESLWAAAANYDLSDVGMMQLGISAGQMSGFQVQQFSAMLPELSFAGINPGPISASIAGMSDYQTAMFAKILGGDLRAASYLSWKGEAPVSSRLYGLDGKPVFMTSSTDFLAMADANLRAGSVGALAAYQAYDQRGRIFHSGIPSNPNLGLQPWQKAAAQNASFRDLYADMAGNPYAEMFLGGMNLLQIGRQYQIDQAGYSMASAGIQAQSIRNQMEFLWGGGAWSGKPAEGSWWALEDRQNRIQWASTIADFRDQKRRMELSRGFTLEGEAIQGQRMDLSQGYTRWQNQFNWGSLQMQQGFARQGWGYQDTLRSLNIAWTMEDFDENARYARGRDRRLLNRQRERFVQSTNLESEQIQKGRAQQETLWQREEARLKKSIEYSERIAELDKAQYDLQRKQSAEFHKLDSEALKRRYSETLALHNLELQMIAKQRDHQVEQLQLSLSAAGVQAAAAKSAKEYAEVTGLTQTAWEEIEGSTEEFMRYDPMKAFKAMADIGKVWGSDSFKDALDKQLKVYVELKKSQSAAEAVAHLFYNINQVSPSKVNLLLSLIQRLQGAGGR